MTTTNTRNRLINEVNDGARTVILSLFHDSQEVEQFSCDSIAEARRIASRELAPRWKWRLPESQWLSLEGGYEFDPHGPEVTRLAAAIFV